MCGWAASEEEGVWFCVRQAGWLRGGPCGGLRARGAPPPLWCVLSFCLRQVPLAPHSTPGYLTLKEVFSYGALMTIVNLTIWGVLGGAWWKALGFF